MDFELLFTKRALETLKSLPRAVQRRLVARFDELERFPHNLSEGQETDAVGRLYDVNRCAGIEIYYWIDVPDRHLKIMALKRVA